MPVNVVFPWIDDNFFNLLWLPAILIIVCVVVLILYWVLYKAIRPENLIIIINALGYAVISLLFSIAFYWYFFLLIMWTSRLPLNKIIKDGINERISENYSDSPEQLSGWVNTKDHELTLNTLDSYSERWKSSKFRRSVRSFEIFTFLFPIVIIILYVLSGIGYRL